MTDPETYLELRRGVNRTRALCQRIFSNSICGLSLCYLLVGEIGVAANDQQCNYADPEGWLLKIAFFVIAFGFVAWGWWIIQTIATRQTWVVGHGILGVGLIFAGFLSINVGLGISAENVSTALGIDASATCYSLSENIRVQPRLLYRNSNSAT